MKVRIIQPLYSRDYSRSDELFEKNMEALRACNEPLDLIVCPESYSVPAYAETKELYMASADKYNAAILKEASETAKRCHSVLFVNAIDYTLTGPRNTTFAYDREGKLVGTYDKQHLVPAEVSVIQLDSKYTFEYQKPTVMEIEGVRYGFLTCYDFYFYENFSNIARQDVDVIIGCSEQRSDLHSALETMTRFLAYNTNAYIVRASVSMGLDSPVGGCSMVVNPKGEVLVNMLSDVGHADVEIDPKDKYYKPAGFGNPPSAHWQYVEKGRRPWKYRPAGSAIVQYDDIMPYPRVCAHRGFSTIAPENSMPAFGAAVAMGAEEIEFDLWYTSDGEVVSIHDSTLDRVSDGHGKVYEHTYEELMQLDFGVKHGEKFTGMKIITFEEILKKLAGHVVMNIHIKTIDDYVPYDKKVLEKIISLIREYDCARHVYFMTGNKPLLYMLREMAPDICRCAGASDLVYDDLVQKAIDTDSKKIQLYKPHFAANGPDYVEKAIKKAHENGIMVNVFWSDDPEETKMFLDLGADTILANDYQRVSVATEEWKKNR